MLRKLQRALFYQTTKLVEIRNAKLGLLHYSIMVVILAYVVGYVILWNAAYQSQAQLVGTANAKVKGNALMGNASAAPLHASVWDSYDVVYPPTEIDALKSSENGILTGYCNTTSHLCELYAWCPLEDDHAKPFLLSGVGNMTVFVKVNVKWPSFGITKDNVPNFAPVAFNASDPGRPGVNLWRVRDMVEQAGWAWGPDVRSWGIVVVGLWTFECNFDRSAAACVPSVEWIRVDDPTSEGSKGFNFRYLREYYTPRLMIPFANHTHAHHNDTQTYEWTLRRDLFKVWGARFIFLVSGLGRKTVSPIPLFTALGSGLGLLTIATVISDLIATRLLPHREYYKAQKYSRVDDPFYDSDEEERSLSANASTHDFGTFT